MKIWKIQWGEGEKEGTGSTNGAPYEGIGKSRKRLQKSNQKEYIID